MKHARSVLVVALALGACGYFNAMYNAKRSYAEAERAAARGEPGVARTAWLEAIDGAASSYRNHPDSRWADDALLLIARARFNLGEYEAARASARAAMAISADDVSAAAAQTMIGAAGFRLGDTEEAAAVLDSAVTRSTADGRPEPLLWRARTRFASGQPGAWEDLDAAAAGSAAIASAAALEGVIHAIDETDRRRFDLSLQRLLNLREGARYADTLLVLLDVASGRFGHSADLVPEVSSIAWPGADREPLALFRVSSLAEAGDTGAAIEQALRLAGRASADNAAAARVLAARLDLDRAQSIEDLAEAREILLPSFSYGRARTLLRTLRVVEVLLERAGRDGQPLAVFAAAELVRDQLGAELLARDLFLAYADLVPEAVWAPKALLAAAALGSTMVNGDDIGDRFAGTPDNVYVRAVLFEDDPDGYARAEERLARSLAVIRFDAYREADERDIRVGSAIARLDSLKAQVLADSMRLVCGTMLDSLALAGIRADSVRSACLRGDTASVSAFLQIDTLLLQDSLADTLRSRRRAIRDTFLLRLK